MRAIILAGGKGTRLLPYTTLIPKPLVPLGGKYSILEIIIMQLVKSGFSHITLAVNHLSHLVMSYFGDGSRFGVTLDYSIEEGELSTIGPLTLIKNLPDNFLVMNGDVLCDLDFREFLTGHIKSDSYVSVSVAKREFRVDFGVLEYDGQNHLTNFKEKPAYPYEVAMGIYCVHRSAIEALKTGMRYGFDNLMLDSLSQRKVVKIRQFSGYWLDIGRPDDYETANKNFSEIAEKLGIEL